MASPGSSGRSSKLLLAVVAAVAVVALLVGGLVFALRPTGPDIVGPRTGSVGNQVAFAVDGPTVNEWRVGGVVTRDQVALVTPESAGELEVTVDTDDGTATITYEVTDDDLPIEIIGPAHLVVGQPTLLSTTAPDGVPLTWLIDGAPFMGDEVEVVPVTPGVLTVSVMADTNGETERIFTVTNSSGS